MQSRIEQLPTGTLRRLNWTKENLLEDIKSHQIYGIDAEHRAARTAKMNMLMWGDGKRVVQGNALGTLDDHGKPLEPAEYDPETPQTGCTLILANPPFGSKEEDQGILNQYQLGSKHQERKSEKTEVLFLEKGMKLLRPEGKMLIVLPQGILSAISHDRVRDYLHSEAEIRAVISLPTHAFVQSGVPTVNTCVLYLQKFTEEKKAIYDSKTHGLSQSEVRDLLRSDSDFDYQIFMGTAEFIGYEPSGRMIVKPGEQTDLDLLLADFANQSDVTQPDIDVFSFADRHYGAKAYRRKDQTIRGTEKGLKTSFVVRLSDTTDRLDPPFLFQRIQAGAVLESLTPLKGTICESGVSFRAKTDDELDAEYPTLSVSSDGKLSASGYLKGEDFTQSYTRVATGDIVYNPSRVNIGSIGLVKASMDGSHVSPEYVVFRSSGLTPEFLIHLLRSPFYKMYIDVVTTGSIRDRLYFGDLENIRVPRVSLERQIEICKESDATESAISKKNVTTSGAIRRTTSRIYELIDPSRTVSSYFETSLPKFLPTKTLADFHSLAQQWKNETRLWPTVTKRCTHPMYQRIIGMGEPVVPYLLLDLKQNGPNDWFWALTAITGENPITDSISGDMASMTEAWIAWGSKTGYLRDSHRKTSESSPTYSEAVTE